ncbi:unnamed protein product [Paramecium sonneborni]|uniref:UDENN domain-containing protein n=1 Tax=Paramecium sonneborni TaxID=65129 RepID=A0A8S1RDM9_9CILI|nr:unnamed protein product [Paramecium sonneborni]
MSIEEIIETFACPNGNNVQQIIDDDVEDEIQRIICQSKVPFQNFYMFNIKGDDLQSENPLNVKLLQQFNHSRQLFGYCLKIDDFLVEDQNGKASIYMSFDKILCFVTYFPIQSLFKKLFEQILFIIKVTRQNSFRVKEKQKKFNEIDGVGIIKLIEKLLNAFMLKSSSYSLTENNQHIEINFAKELADQNLDEQMKQFFQSSIISYTVPSKEDLFFETKKLEAHIVLTLFTFEQFYKIFMEILKEGKIIFCCQNQNLLTSITSFFHTSLFPFKWFHQIIFNLPIDSLALLEFNQPIIFGVNMQYQQLRFQRNILIANKIHDITYVDINERHRLINIIEKNQKVQLNWVDQKKELERYFQDKNGSLSFTPNNEQENNAKKFLKNLQEIIMVNLINKVVPKREEDFIIKQNKKLNDHFISHRIKKIIQKTYQDQLDQKFILNYIILSVYFTEFLRFQYIK